MSNIVTLATTRWNCFIVSCVSFACLRSQFVVICVSLLETRGCAFRRGWGEGGGGSRSGARVFARGAETRVRKVRAVMVMSDLLRLLSGARGRTLQTLPQLSANGQTDAAQRVCVCVVNCLFSCCWFMCPVDTQLKRLFLLLQMCNAFGLRYPPTLNVRWPYKRWAFSFHLSISVSLHHLRPRCGFICGSIDGSIYLSIH